MKKELVFKIRYKLNLLPECGIHALRCLSHDHDQETIDYLNENISILNLCTGLDEIDVFLTDCL
jgi:hypothetical protein